MVSTTIAGIDFGIAENKPIVDYNHIDLESKTVGHEVNSWNNDGTGGNTYDIGSNVGSPDVSDVTDHLSKRSAILDGSDHFVVPTLTVQNDYTLYVAYQSKYAHAIYSDGDGECLDQPLADCDGLKWGYHKDEIGSLGRFVTRHHGFGAFPNTDVNNEDNGTVGYIYPLADVDQPQLFRFCNQKRF